MGAAKEGLQPLWDAVHASDVPLTQFLPTHVERTPQLINEGAKWIAAGGRVDLTCRTEQVLPSCYLWLLICCNDTLLFQDYGNTTTVLTSAARQSWIRQADALAACIQLTDANCHWALHTLH